MSCALRLRAAAKVNLALRVGPLGDDGFHPVATVLQTVSLGDVLYARPAAGGDAATGGAGSAMVEPLRDRGAGAGSALLHLTVRGAELPADNTVRRAVELLAAEAPAHGVAPVPLRLHLVKRVPGGAGLGGGSSDAVAALAAAIRLWGLDRRRLQRAGTLQRIAERIGSDVPFFLCGGTARGSGRGTRIAPLEPLTPAWLVVAAPELHVATVDAYAAFDERRGAAAVGSPAAGGVRAPAPAAPGPRRAAGPVSPSEVAEPPYQPRLDAAWMGNDLAAAVAALYPEVEAVRRRLVELGAATAQMTGSGAASFGAFGGRRAAARAARRLLAEGLWARVALTTGAAQHRRALWGAAGDA